MGHNEPQPNLLLGLESGGTKLVAVVTTPSGEAVSSKERKRPQTNRASDTVEQLFLLGKEAVAQAGARSTDLIAVGWGFGGAVNRPRNQPGINLHEEGWDQINGTKILQQAFGVPVYCENDCNVAALAEANLGAGVKRGTSIYITVGSGVGSGITVDGEILALSPWGEAELGHIVIDPDGPMCFCGNRGCLETFCSGWGIANRALEQAEHFVSESAFARRIHLIPQEQIARELFVSYPEDPLSATMVRQFSHRMALATSYLVNLLTPSLIVFGGGVMQSTWLVDDIKKLAQAYIYPHLQLDCKFIPAELNKYVVSQGAALYARKQAEAKGDYHPLLGSDD